MIICDYGLYNYGVVIIYYLSKNSHLRTSTFKNETLRNIFGCEKQKIKKIAAVRFLLSSNYL